MTAKQTCGDVALVFILAVVIYLNVLKGEFVFDDLVAIVDNKDVKPDQPLEEVFQHDFWGQKMEDWQSHKSFRPLTILSFRLSYILSGERWDEVHFHLTNVVLHAMVSVLVLPVAYRCFGPSRRFAALTASLFFATHPIHTDAVSSIVSRGEQLSGLFLLLSLLAYTQAASRSSGLLATLFWVPLSIALAFVGMLCKEQAITVVAIQAAFDLGAVAPILSSIGSCLRRRPSTASDAQGTADPKSNQQQDSKGGDTDSQDQNGDGERDDNGDGGEEEELPAARPPATESDLPPPFGLPQAVLMCLRLSMLAVAFAHIYSWRMSKNGDCVTVYKNKGDPLISAWDAAGTVAPGVYSESACRPSFLQVENPARFVRGEGASLTQALTWHYCAAYNAYLLLNPAVLRADYSHGTVPLLQSFDDPRNNWTALFWALLLGLVLLGFVLACGPAEDCAVLLSIAMMVVPFIPSSNLFFPVGFVIAERVLYTPSIGYCMLLALLFEALDVWAGANIGAQEPRKGQSNTEHLPLREWTGGQKAVRAVVALIVALYSVRTWVRNYDWVSREGFYGAMIRDNPGNPKAHYGYGNVVINDVKRTDIGEKHLLEASRLQPNYFDAYNDLGAWYNRNGDLEKAKTQFDFAVRAKPEHINGLSNQGLNLLNMKDYENAFMVFDKAVEFFPDSADFYNHMGMALQGLGMQEDALQAYSDIIVLDPLSPRSYYLYAIAAGQMGRTEEAEVYLRNALRIRPWYLDALYNLGVCLMKQDRMEEAYAYFLRVHYVNHQHPGLAQYMEMLRGF